MSLAGLLLGLINIAIVVVFLLFIGLVCKWGIKLLFKTDTSTEMDRMFVALVGLIGLYMLIALAFGLPSLHVIGTGPVTPIFRWHSTPSLVAPETR